MILSIDRVSHPATRLVMYGIFLVLTIASIFFMVSDWGSTVTHAATVDINQNQLVPIDFKFVGVRVSGNWGGGVFALTLLLIQLGLLSHLH